MKFKITVRAFATDGKNFADAYAALSQSDKDALNDDLKAAMNEDTTLSEETGGVESLSMQPSGEPVVTDRRGNVLMVHIEDRLAGYV